MNFVLAANTQKTDRSARAPEGTAPLIKPLLSRTIHIPNRSAEELLQKLRKRCREREIATRFIAMPGMTWWRKEAERAAGKGFRSVLVPHRGAVHSGLSALDARKELCVNYFASVWLICELAKGARKALEVDVLSGLGPRDADGHRLILSFNGRGFKWSSADMETSLTNGHVVGLEEVPRSSPCTRTRVRVQ